MSLPTERTHNQRSHQAIPTLLTNEGKTHDQIRAPRAVFHLHYKIYCKIFRNFTLNLWNWMGAGKNFHEKHGHKIGLSISVVVCQMATEVTLGMTGPLK